MELSAVLITYNAEKHLQRVLEALLPVADEIVIVDSGSTDATKAIAERFPLVRWYEKPFDGYGSQKNYANTLAQGRYILSIDADEVLSPELQAAILRQKGGWQAEAYRFLRIAIYCGRAIRAGDWYPDWKVRLFRKGKAHWSTDPVHERLLLAPGTTLGTLPGELWHYTYDSIEENFLRTSRYAWLAARASYQQGYKPRWGWAFLRAASRFLKSLFLKSGWRAGWRGVSIAFIGACAYVLKELYLAHLYETSQSLSDEPAHSPSLRSMHMGAADPENHPPS